MSIAVRFEVRIVIAPAIPFQNFISKHFFIKLQIFLKTTCLYDWGTLFSSTSVCDAIPKYVGYLKLIFIKGEIIDSIETWKISTIQENQSRNDAIQITIIQIYAHNEDDFPDKSDEMKHGALNSSGNIFNYLKVD